MSRIDRLILVSYGAVLLTLPWAGLGVLRMLTGRDWGGGLQLSWVFMAVVVMVDFGRRSVYRRWRQALFLDHGGSATGVGLGMLFAGAVVLSAIGLIIVFPPVSAHEAWARYAKQIFQLVIMLVFTGWVGQWTRGRERWTWTARLVVIGALLQVGYGVLQILAYGGHVAWFGAVDRGFTSNPAILSGSGELYLNNAMQHVPRLRGTACEPLYLGNYLLLALPLVALTRWRPLTRIAAAFLLVALLLSTWSRGAWLAGLAALGVAAVIGGGGSAGRWRCFRPLAIRKGADLLLVLALILILAAVMFWLPAADWNLPVQRLKQTFSAQDWSNLTRFYSMQAGWRAFLLSPVFGIGWGQFGWHFPALVDPLGLQSQFTWPVVNNFYLEVLCETGLLGLITLLLWLWRCVWVCWRGVISATRLDPWERTRTVAVLAAFTGVWLQLMTFSQYNLPHIWVGLGLLLACARETAHPEGRQQP